MASEKDGQNSEARSPVDDKIGLCVVSVGGAEHLIPPFELLPFLMEYEEHPASVMYKRFSLQEIADWDYVGDD